MFEGSTEQLLYHVNSRHRVFRSEISDDEPIFPGRLVTATHPTSEPFSLARKQPSGSNASEEMRFFVPGRSRNCPRDSPRILRRTSCSSDPMDLRVISDNDCCLLSALCLEGGCLDCVL